MVLGLVEPESSASAAARSSFTGRRATRRLRSYDGRETAPAAARADRFLKEDKLHGVRRSGRRRALGRRPGVLRMLELAHARHGRLPWSELFQPAIAAAEAGFRFRRACSAARARSLPSQRSCGARHFL
jgi:gamma-glutamyltranspeptidase/glutathione hydrolase